MVSPSIQMCDFDGRAFYDTEKLLSRAEEPRRKQLLPTRQKALASDSRDATYPKERAREVMIKGAIHRSFRWLGLAERIHALIQAVRHLTTNRIRGAVVECGVWKSCGS